MAGTSFTLRNGDTREYAAKSYTHALVLATKGGSHVIVSKTSTESGRLAMVHSASLTIPKRSGIAERYIVEAN